MEPHRMTSFAKTLSNTPVDATSPRPEFENAGENATAEKRPSLMVANDRPAPAPRPSPALAHEVDRAAFNERWDRESDAAREQRKAAFKEKRKSAHEPNRSRAKSFNRVVTR